MSISKAYDKFQADFFRVRRKKRLHKKLYKKREDLFVSAYLRKNPNQAILVTFWLVYKSEDLRALVYSRNPFIEAVQKEESWVVGTF